MRYERRCTSLLSRLYDVVKKLKGAKIGALGATGRLRLRPLIGAHQSHAQLQMSKISVGDEVCLWLLTKGEIIEPMKTNQPTALLSIMQSPAVAILDRTGPY